MRVAIVVVSMLIIANYLLEFVIEPRSMRKKILSVLEQSSTSLSTYEIRRTIAKNMRFFGISNNMFHIALRKLIDNQQVLIDDGDVGKYGIRYCLPIDHVAANNKQPTP